MRVPHGRVSRGGKALLVLAVAWMSGLGMCGVGWAEKQAEAWVKVSLEPLGYPGASVNLLNQGASLLTVNFVDDSHLLVTYGLRGLIARVQGETPNVGERMVRAQLVEIPSGKVVAQTEWRAHDYGRYLWSLGKGRFLVRIGRSLSVMAPVANLGASDPFVRTAFPYRGLLPNDVYISVDGEILTVQSQVSVPRAKGAATWADAGEQETSTLVDLYRLSGKGSMDDPIKVTATRSARSARELLLAVDEDGYLWQRSDEKNNQVWSLSFNSFGGKVMDVGKVESACQPRLGLLSRSDYLALTCRGSEDRLKLMTYGFDGHENWEEPFDNITSVMFAYAPVAGRFAMSRVSDGPPLVATVGDADGPVVRQEVRVYQSESGDLLLKVPCTPVMKTAENFDMTEDGTLAAVVRDGAVALYKLPGLSSRDKKDMAEVAKFAPPVVGATDLPLTNIVVQVDPGVMVAGAVAQAVPPVGVQQRANSGDVASVDAPRKKPSLLLPGEKPEFKDKTAPAAVPDKKPNASD